MHRFTESKLNGMDNRFNKNTNQKNMPCQDYDVMLNFFQENVSTIKLLQNVKESLGDRTRCFDA